MKFSQAIEYLEHLVSFNLKEAEMNRHDRFVIPFFIGDPGIGKTAIAKRAARNLGLPYFQTIVAQYDAGEMAGLPFVGKKYIMEDGKEHEYDQMIRLRPSYLPDIRDPDERVGIYNLDELPQAFLANQNIMSQLVNEWRIGDHQLSRGITICATGNKPENKAGTTAMPMHLKDRLCFVEVEHDVDEWMQWAAGANVDPRIRAFLRNNPQHLHKFDVGANAFPTPRSWEKASVILNLGLSQSTRTQALLGTIGHGTGTLFEQWIRVEDKMPKLEDVIRNPESAPVFGNERADILYLLLTALADATTKENIGQVLKYIKRLPNQEFVAMWSKDVGHRDPSLYQTPDMTKWKLTDGAKAMLG